MMERIRRHIVGSRALVLDGNRARARHFGSTPSGNTTSIQSTTPWSGQQPYLTDIYSQAQNLDQSTPPQYYPGNTYAGLTNQQTGLMSNLINYGSGGGNTGLQAANNSVTAALNPSYTSGTSGAFGQGQGVLSNEMSSAFLNPNNNPGYQTAIGNAMASAIPAASASFVNGNRSDSGLAQAATTSAAANAAGGLAANQYNTNLGIQNAAAGQAASNYLAQQGNQIKAGALAPMIDQAQSGDMANALSTAGMAQTDAQNQISANMARFNYGQMLPYNQLSMYEQAVAGMGNPGSSTSTSQPYFTNPVANVASGLSSLGSLGMLGMMAFSDRRLKTDIEQIGTASNDLPLYAFRYKWEGPMSRHIGLMAQDVAKVAPDAVMRTPSGFLAVDYGKALAA